MIYYGNLETITGIFIPEETRPQCAQFVVDALYAWYKQDLIVYVPGSDNYHYYKAYHCEEIMPPAP